MWSVLGIENAENLRATDVMGHQPPRGYSVIFKLFFKFLQSLVYAWNFCQGCSSANFINLIIFN